MGNVTTNWNKVSFEVLKLLNKKFKLKMTKTEIKNKNIYIFFLYKTYVIVIFKNVNNNVLFIAFYYVCACKLH